MSCLGRLIGGFFRLSSFEERVKEASSSEVPQKKGPVRTYSDSLERSRSVPMQSHLGSVVLCLALFTFILDQLGFNFMLGSYASCYTLVMVG